MSVRADPVGTLYREFRDLVEMLDASGQASARSFVDGNFRKILLLSAASYFEREMIESLTEFTREVVRDDHVLVAVVVGRVIERQYHTWFDWKASNVNQFLRMFGATFAEQTREVIRLDEGLSESVRGFLEIGRERNRVVHQDFVSFRMEKTSEEIYDTYIGARRFVEWFRTVLSQHVET